MANYRITLDGDIYDPTNFGGVEIKLEPFREFGAYAFRRLLGGELNFYNDAYAYISAQIAISQCQEIAVVIEQRCNGVFEPILSGYFTRQACEVNLDTCTISVELTTTDEYSCILDNQDKQINVLEEPCGVSGACLDLPYVPTFGLQVMAVSNFGTVCSGVPIPEWGVPYNLGAYTSGTGQNYCMYARYVTRVPCVAGEPQEPPPAVSAWTLLSDDCAIDGTATYWRVAAVSEIILTFSDTFCAGVCTPPLCSLFSIDAGVFPVPFPVGFERICATAVYTEYILPNGRELIYCINYILAQICGTGIVIDSELLTNNINPVTGTTPNPLQFLALFAKSDIINASGSDLAWQANVSIEEALGDLSAIFNALWYVDTTTNKLIFEHVTAILSNVVGTDLTTLDGGKWAKGRNLIKWDKEEVPRAETFNFVQPCAQQDFIGFPIDYTQGCSTARSIETRTAKIETELTRIYQNTQEDKTGLVLIAYASILQDDQADEVGELSQLFIPNAPLSWANLHRDYFHDWRFLTNGTLNNVATVFDSTRPIKRQDGLVFPLCCLNDFNPLELIKTEIGSGRLESASYNLASGMMTVAIKFEDL